MLRFPNQNILWLTVEGRAEFCQRIQIDVPRLTSVETVNKILGHPGAFRQFTRRDALAGFGLLLAQKNGNTSDGGEFCFHKNFCSNNTVE